MQNRNQVAGETLAVVLAGGRGARMGVLCDYRPKPALPLGGKYRVIDFALSNCINSQMRNIMILTDYRWSYLGGYLQYWNSINPCLAGLQVLEPRKTCYSGTADAAYSNIDNIKRYAGDTVLVLPADHIYEMDYRRMLAFHRGNGADVTIGTRLVSGGLPDSGIVGTDREGRVMYLGEKHGRPAGNLASTGIYIFNKTRLIECLEADAADTMSSHDLGCDVVPRMIGGDRAFAYEFAGYWRDIDTPRAYLQANLDLASEQARIGCNDQWPVITASTGLSMMESERSCKNSNSIIDSRSSVEGWVQNSIISQGVRVGEGAVVRNSVLMDNVDVGPGSLVESAILEQGVHLGDFCRIGANGDDVTVLRRETTLPAFTYTWHDNAELMELRETCLPVPTGVPGD